MSKVLVVDDNPVNIAVALGFLAIHKIKAETASSGAEAIRLLEEKARSESAYDLVLMDHMMPEMDGIETTMRIRGWEKKGNRKQTPIVALSASTAIGVEKTFLSAGMNDYLSKPIIADELSRVLRQWLPDIGDSSSVAMQRSDAVQSSGSGSSNDRLLDELAQIKGLDVSAGLSHVGQNQESYFLALRQFAENCDTYLEDLAKAMKAESWADYSIRAHALKGVLAAFGVERLSMWAANLEHASMAGADFSPETCREETAPFCAALSQFRDKLRLTSLLLAENTDNILEGDEIYMADKKIILAVDDMPENLTIIRSILKDYFDIRLAKSAKLALSLLEDLKVDLILLDIEMPGMSGFEFIRRLDYKESLNKKTPIIVVTSHAEKKNFTDAINAGARDYVIKPVNAEALFKKIEAIIGLPESKTNPMEGNLKALKTAIASGDSVHAEGLTKELLKIASTADFIQVSESMDEIAKLILSFEYEKGMEKIDALLHNLALDRKW